MTTAFERIHSSKTLCCEALRATSGFAPSRGFHCRAALIVLPTLPDPLFSQRRRTLQCHFHTGHRAGDASLASILEQLHYALPETFVLPSDVALVGRLPGAKLFG